jgi:hypothetical protein
MTCASGDFMCIAKQCSGGVGAGTVLFNYWETNNCPAAYGQILNTGTGGILEYNPDGQALVQELVVQLFDTYFQTNQLTDNVTSTSYNTFQNTLLNLCINPTLPGVCGQFLGGTAGATGYCGQYTRTDVINSPTLTNFCGCYIPPDPVYLQYTLGSPGCQIGTGCTAGCTAGNEGCTGQPACDPLCHRALTSQKAYDPTGTIITCPQTICVIDNVVINADSSRVPGGINFNNSCSGCVGATGNGSSGCLCVVSGVNISQTMSNIGIGTNFNQFCGPGSVCIVEDSNGNIISEGGCTGINPVNAGIPLVNYLPTVGILFIMFLVLALVLFISITARFASPKVEVPVVEYKPPPPIDTPILEKRLA